MRVKWSALFCEMPKAAPEAPSLCPCCDQRSKRHAINALPSLYAPSLSRMEPGPHTCTWCSSHTLRASTPAHTFRYFPLQDVDSCYEWPQLRERGLSLCLGGGDADVSPHTSVGSKSPCVLGVCSWRAKGHCCCCLGPTSAKLLGAREPFFLLSCLCGCYLPLMSVTQWRELCHPAVAWLVPPDRCPTD